MVAADNKQLTTLMTKMVLIFHAGSQGMTDHEKDIVLASIVNGLMLSRAVGDKPEKIGKPEKLYKLAQETMAFIMKLLNNQVFFSKEINKTILESAIGGFEHGTPDEAMPHDDLDLGDFEFKLN